MLLVIIKILLVSIKILLVSIKMLLVSIKILLVSIKIVLVGRSDIFQFYLHHGKFCNSVLHLKTAAVTMH